MVRPDHIKPQPRAQGSRKISRHLRDRELKEVRTSPIYGLHSIDFIIYLALYITTNSYRATCQVTNLDPARQADLWQDSCLQALTPRIAHLWARGANLSALLLALACATAAACWLLGALLLALIQGRLRLGIGLIRSFKLGN